MLDTVVEICPLSHQATCNAEWHCLFLQAYDTELCTLCSCAAVYMMDGRSGKLLQHLGLDDQLPIIGWQTNEANVICAHPDGSITRRRFPIKDKSIVSALLPSVPCHSAAKNIANSVLCLCQLMLQPLYVCVLKHSGQSQQLHLTHAVQ